MGYLRRGDWYVLNRRGNAVEGYVSRDVIKVVRFVAEDTGELNNMTVMVIGKLGRRVEQELRAQGLDVDTVSLKELKDAVSRVIKNWVDSSRVL